MNSRVFRIVAAPLAIAMLMAAAPAKASPQSSVTAGGAVELPAEFGEFAGDHVQVHVTARQGPDGSAQGRFSIVHQRPPGLWARVTSVDGLCADDVEPSCPRPVTARDRPGTDKCFRA